MDNHMTTTVILQIASPILGVVGSWFFAKAVIRQSSSQMANMASTYWDTNPEMSRSLASQKADYIIILSASY